MFCSPVKAQIPSKSPKAAQLPTNVAVSAIEPLTYTVAEAAAILAVSKPSIYRLLARNLLRPVPGLRIKRIARRQVHVLANGGRLDRS